MKKILLLLLLMTNSLQLILASHDIEDVDLKKMSKTYDRFSKKIKIIDNYSLTNSEEQETATHESLRYAAQYLRIIRALKRSHQIPRLKISSIINNTSVDLIMTDTSMKNYHFLKAGEETETSLFISKFKNKLSRENKMLGTCDEFSFFIGEILFESFINDKTTCWIDLAIELDENNFNLNVDLPSIKEMSINLFTKDNTCYGLALLRICKSNNCQSDEIKVTIKISETDLNVFPNHSKFYYSCFLSK